MFGLNVTSFFQVKKCRGSISFFILFCLLFITPRQQEHADKERHETEFSDCENNPINADAQARKVQPYSGTFPC